MEILRFFLRLSRISRRRPCGILAIFSNETATTLNTPKARAQPELGELAKGPPF